MWDGGWSCGNGTHCEAVTLQTGTAVLCLAAGPGEERTGHRASAHTIYYKSVSEAWGDVKRQNFETQRGTREAKTLGQGLIS